MRQRGFWAVCASILLLTTALTTSAAPSPAAGEVTDFGRTPYRTHYTPAEPEYPLANGVQAIWEVPLGLSRSQPLVVQRDFDGDGYPDTRIYHLAGDRLWALNGDQIPEPRAPGQSVASYQAELRRQGFILWDTPVEALCAGSGPAAFDDLLARKCAATGPRPERRPFASSQATYVKGATPAEDRIYVGFGHPASLVALRATNGQVLGGYIVDAFGDRGIVGAPLVFDGDLAVIGTTAGEVFMIKGLASGYASHRKVQIGGRISFSPVPIGASGFIIASDARWAPDVGNHGYMMALGLNWGSDAEFAPRWPAAVMTPAGIPGEAAIDGQAAYFADKYGKLYALRIDTGEMLWCRQFPGLGPCQAGGNPQPAFINNGPGVDEENVYFVVRNDQGPNTGTGYVVALHKSTGQPAWQQPMPYAGNTAPVPMRHIVIAGDTGGYVRAYDKESGAPVAYGGYPLQLSDEPYKAGMQGERWWEPIGGTATQMSVAADMMLVGVNSESEERTLLKAYRLHRLPDLVAVYLDTPPTAGADGFVAKFGVACRGCDEPLTTSISLKIDGHELPRQVVTFRPENGWQAERSWTSGPVAADAQIEVVATINPDGAVAESDRSNNTLRAVVAIPVCDTCDPSDGWGSRLTN